MVDYAGNAIPVAGITRGPNVPDDELLSSTVGYRQKGVTLAAGQGVLLLGTVLARKTSTKEYVAWENSAGDGVGTPVGILRKTVDTGTDPNGQRYFGNIVVTGLLKLSKVSYANGGVADVLSDLNASTNEVLDQFKF